LRRRIGSSRGLFFPSALAEPGGSRLARAYRTRFAPPSGFGYPLDGLLPPGSGRPYLMPTALLGFPPFGASSFRKVSPGVSTRDEPTCRLPCRSPLQANPAAERGRPRLLGFDPFGSPLAGLPQLALTSAGCSLGFRPFQGSSTSGLAAIPHRLLPHTWQDQPTYADWAPVPRSIDGHSTSPAANA